MCAGYAAASAAWAGAVSALYVGLEEEIPGVKIETWGTLFIFCALSLMVLEVFEPRLFDVGVGHSSYVVGDGACHSFFCDSSLVIERKQLRFLRPGFVKRFHDMIGAFMLGFEGWRLV